MGAQTDDPRVGILLLNWNQPEYTLECLESLKRLEYSRVEIVIVDNGSTDGSPDLFRQRYPEVVVIQNGQNLGFAAGNNVGIRYLMERSVDYLLLLNNDTEVPPNLICHLVKVAESDTSIGIVGPKILYYHPQSLIWFGGGVVDSIGRSSHVDFNQVDGGINEPIRDVDYVTGCALLIKSKVVGSVGMLDERFFIYYEEVEWCARVRNAGYRVVYVPQAHMWHKIEQAARNQSSRYLYLMARNRLLYLKCTRASALNLTLACLDILRTSMAWALKPKYREVRPLSRALVHGVRDWAFGRFGPPPSQP